MDFEWSRPKAVLNVEKHGVTFEEAVTVFDDPGQIYLSDDVHSVGEERFFCIGFSDQRRLLTVVCTERPSDVYRIISARESTTREQQEYERKNYNP